MSGERCRAWKGGDTEKGKRGEEKDENDMRGGRGRKGKRLEEGRMRGGKIMLILYKETDTEQQ